MAFYNFTKAVLNKKSDFRTQIAIELDNLNKELEFQKNRKQSLSFSAQNLTEGINVFESNADSQTIFNYLNGLKENIEYININIDKISNLISELNNFLVMLDDGTAKEIITETFEIYKKAYTREYSEILDRNIKIENYLQIFYKNSKFNMPTLANAFSSEKIEKDTLIDMSKAHLKEVQNKIENEKYDYNIDLDKEHFENTNNSNLYNFEDYNNTNNTSSDSLNNSSYSTSNISDNSKTLEEEPVQENFLSKEKEEITSYESNKFTSSSDDIILDISKNNNTLIISELKGQVFLPYKIEDLKRKLELYPYKYSSLEDVVKKEYIIPIKRYKYSSVSRFKETFNLMRYKEKASFISSIELALELTFNYNLNPAIITACNNLDELDVYLDCLEELEIDDFKIFTIIYEVAPTIVNKKF